MREIIDIPKEISIEIKDGISNIREKIQPSAINFLNNQVIILGNETQIRNCKLLFEALILSLTHKLNDKSHEKVKSSSKVNQEITLPKEIFEYTDLMSQEKLKEIETNYVVKIYIKEELENMKILLEGNDEQKINELIENVIPKVEDYIISKEDFTVMDNQSLDIITSAKFVSHIV